MVLQGPLYLIKIKESKQYGARDLLWAIGQKMEEPLNFGGMKSLVEGINKKGLFTPKLVEQGASKTWGEVKGQVQLQAFQIVGSPTTLFENVHSFYRILSFAYEAGILDNMEGHDMLENLTAAVIPGAAASG